MFGFMGRKIKLRKRKTILFREYRSLLCIISFMILTSLAKHIGWGKSKFQGAKCDEIFPFITSVEGRILLGEQNGLIRGAFPPSLPHTTGLDSYESYT